MTAKILPFQPCRGAPMSQVGPLPRVDVRTYTDDRGNVVFDVELVRHEGQDGFDVLATFGDADDAEAFADRWMGDHPELGGGRWTGFDDPGGAA